jgi:superfamily II DNA/RNA helicase
MQRQIIRQCHRFVDPRFSRHLLANLPPHVTQWTNCQETLFRELGNRPPSHSPPDIILQSFTGSGKTFAYLLPLIDKHILKDDQYASPKILVIVPTRELAYQIGEVACNLVSGFSSFSSVMCGSHIPSDWSKSSILISTPGALLRATESHHSLPTIQTVVMDEFDRLFDFGFISQIEQILSRINPLANLVLVSATIPTDVRLLAERLVRPGALVVVDPSASPPQLTHSLVEYEPINFFATLRNVLAVEGKKLVIFPTTKSLLFFYAAMKIELKNVSALHGRMGHEKRKYIVANYRQGTNSCLFTTDVAARGLDFPDIQTVVHIGFSGVENPIEQYIHRSGRTGRGSESSGESVLMVGTDLDSKSTAMKNLMTKIGHMTKRSFSPSDPATAVISTTDPTYKYLRHLSTKCVESLLLWHLERRKRFGSSVDKTVVAKSVIDMVRSAGLPQPYVSSKVAKKLGLDTIPGLLLIRK